MLIVLFVTLVTNILSFGYFFRLINLIQPITKLIMKKRIENVIMNLQVRINEFTGISFTGVRFIGLILAILVIGVMLQMLKWAGGGGMEYL
jgi:hypothetical protein